MLFKKRMIDTVMIMMLMMMTMSSNSHNNNCFLSFLLPARS